MISRTLQARLESAARRHRSWILAWQLAACWGSAALLAAALGLVSALTDWALPWSEPLALGAAAAGTLILWLRHRSLRSDYRALARQIERLHPELNGLLLTAVQQEVPESGPAGYLQHRLLEQAVDHGLRHDWHEIVPRRKLRLARAAQAAALALLAASAALLGLGREPALRGRLVPGVAVTPGDTSLERGESLVVLARFDGRLPSAVSLVARSSGAAPRRIDLVKSLADPIFGGSVPEVDQDFTYHLEYGLARTREFKVAVFEHPRLERSDAVLTYPGYTRLQPKRIENTRRVSGVAGTRLDLALQLNKPVASAALVAADAKKTVIPLQLEPGKAAASLRQFPLVASQTYDLQLVDPEGRKNTLATPFTFEVSPDRPPELQVSAPGGDIRPSAIEEVRFAGSVLGEFGVAGYGLAYSRDGGATTTVIPLGRDVPPREKRSFETVLHLEDLGVSPGQVITWYAWADDTGPDGKTRRTSGDLYFAEIRPFDEIFRENSGMSGSGGQGGAGSESQRLTEIEKEIITATWKLQRDPAAPKFAGDTKVVHDAQGEALGQAEGNRKNADDPRGRALWSAVTAPMTQAASRLAEAGRNPAALGPALAAEQSAYQSLLRLQGRETQVSRGSRGGGGGGGAAQRELDQLDLSQNRNRYETQRDAAADQNPQQQEKLQVMSRLQELARRQQDVNDRLKELQTALQEARTDQEREDLRKQLKRLQDEQQQVVSDVDELRQRMDRPENQSALSEQRSQLERTRQDTQQAADAAAQGDVSGALNSGTRAQRGLEDMRDQLHRQNSSRFADDLRSMRAEARQLAGREEAISRQLDPAAAAGQPKRLSESAETGPAPQLDEQKQRLGALVERAKTVAQQAEDSEPLLAEKLYDSLRQLGQADTGTAKELQQELLNGGLLTRSLEDHLSDTSGSEGTKSLDLASALLREGYRRQAAEAEQRARAGIEQLRGGVEKAAESVIGDDTDALRLARTELDAAARELQREAANPNGTPGPNPAPSGDQPAPSGGQPAGQPGASSGQGQLADAGAPNSPGQGAGRGRGGLPLDRLLRTAAGPAGGGAAGGAPITGDGYGAWSDRLREVEQIVDAPDLRNAVAAARERARLLRLDYSRNLKKPDWAQLQLEVEKPLIEVRNQISDELARRESKDSLAPIDRDPVPSRYAESVRKYYEALGK